MPTLREALKEDLDRLKMTQKAFTETLPISQQALNYWFQKGEIPRSRQSQVVGILGENSSVAAGLAKGFDPESPDEKPSFLRTSYAGVVDTAPESPFTKREELRRAFLGDRFAQHGEMLELIRAELPHVSLDAMVALGTSRRRLDYNSSVMAANIITAPTVSMDRGRNIVNPSALARRILDLALIRKAERVKDKYYVLVLILGELIDAPGTSEAVARAVWEAGQFGVSVLTARSYAEAARLLIDIETERSNPSEDVLLDDDTSE